jgi:hypothetical protein
MSDEANLEDRRIRFEARKLAIETYIKVHVERASGATMLVASYFRLIFTLSLGTLAAVVTLGTTWARFGRPNALNLNDPRTVAASMAAGTFLIVSAVLAANGLREAAGGSLKSVRDPLPENGTDIETALVQRDITEHDIFRHMVKAIDEIANSSAANRPSFLPPLIAYVLAVICALLTILRVTS